MKKIFIACMALFALAACEDDIDHSGEVHATADELHSIEVNSAVFEASIYGNGVTERGVCWSETANPTLTDFSVADAGKGSGAFTAELTGLKANTTYYARAYGIAGTKTYFSSTREFSTFANLTTTITAAVADMYAMTVTAEVKGGADSWTISERGICYATTPNPTVAGSKVRAAGSKGAFTVELPNLNIETKYYLRGYAIYDGGTVYGSEVEVSTLKASGLFYGPLQKAGMKYGIIRKDDKFVMHYTFDVANEQIAITYIEPTGDRDAKHITRDVTYTDGDVKKVSWTAATVGDFQFTGMSYDGTTFTAEGSTGISLDASMKAADIYAMYVNRNWGGVDRSSDICDQAEQPACFPSSYFTSNWVKEFSAGQCGIVCYYAYAQTYLFFKNTVDGNGKPVIPITEDVAHFSYSGNHVTPYGSLTDEEYNKAYEATKPLLDLWNDADGLMIIKEEKSSLTPEQGDYNYYAISPTGTFWAKLYFRAYGK